MTPAWINGRMPCRPGQHFVMTQRQSDGSFRYAVYVARTRGRDGHGTAELLAEFRSKRLARKWSNERDLPRKMRSTCVG